MTPDEQLDLSAIVKELKRLVRGMEALDKSVAKLSSRIQSPSDEMKSQLDAKSDDEYFGGTEWVEEWEPRLKPTARGILRAVRAADGHFQDLEIFVRRIESKIDQIASDSWSRTEFRKHLSKP